MQDKDYVPGITVKQILLGIQDLLQNPNIEDPAQRDAAVLFKTSVPAYKARVRELAKRTLKRTMMCSEFVRCCKSQRIIPSRSLRLLIG